MADAAEDLRKQGSRALTNGKRFSAPLAGAATLTEKNQLVAKFVEGRYEIRLLMLCSWGRAP